MTLYKIFKENEERELNFTEPTKEWENSFYESEWSCDTLKYSKVEEDIIKELTTFLPRHMSPYDWNLPFADEIILIFRRHLQSSKQSQLALIDGVIDMVEEMKKVEDINPLNNFYDGVEHGYNLALSDLKDKLLADRKLIEENK